MEKQGRENKILENLQNNQIIKYRIKHAVSNFE